MAGRTARDAHDAFASAHQRALLCVTQAHFQTEGHRNPNALHRADLGASPTPLRSTVPSSLRILLRYRIIEASVPSRHWAVQLAEYFYSLTDNAGRELFAYHWHPTGRSAVTWPHFHLGPALGQIAAPATKAHFPTGLIAIEDVIRLAIRWFGVVPQRPDWEAVLDGTRQLFPELCPPTT